MKRPELILFAKQPLVGQVKTRLAADLGAQRAADIAAALVRATVEQATSYWPGEVWLYGSPSARHPLFEELADRFHLRLAAQTDGDLGARMASALADGLARRGVAAVMGCDVPHCPGDVLEQAYEQLAKERAVLGPSLDGGYYLLGLAVAVPQLFPNMPWGTDQVASETERRAAQLGLQFHRLPALRDIDTLPDLRAAVAMLPSLAALLPDGAIPDAVVAPPKPRAR